MKRVGMATCQAQLAKEKITFRDLDIIQHFLADNGCAPERRTFPVPL